MADHGAKIDEVQGNDIYDYQFETFDNIPATDPDRPVIKGFELKEVEVRDGIEEIEYQETVSRERKIAKEQNFIVSPIVKEFRGIKEQEQQEKQKLIDEKVSKKVLRVKEQAYKDGYEEGLKQGRQEVYEETKKQTEEKLESLLEMISDTLSTQKRILSEQKSEIFTMIRNLTKWIVLRELSEDGEYINRLLEKLIQELDERSNIFVQVNQKDFEKMPEVLEVVGKRLGELKNVRVEIDYDIVDYGIVVEADSGIVNGSMEQQFNHLDKLFESVGVPGASHNKLNIYESEVDLKEEHHKEDVEVENHVDVQEKPAVAPDFDRQEELPENNESDDKDEE